MRNAVPLLLIVLAAAAGWWLLTAADDDLPESGYESGGVFDEEGRGEGLRARQLEAEGLAVKGRKPGPPQRPVVPIPDPRTLPTGNLSVTFVGPDLAPLDSGALQVLVEPDLHGSWRTRQGLYEKEKQHWRFKEVVAGPVRVRVQGDHVVGKTVKAAVKRDRDNELSVTLDLAGAIQYDVIAYDKKRPPRVKLTLYDYRKKPVRAWYQERSTRRMTSPKLEKTAEIGPEGVLFAILPGRYHLRVVSAFEEWDEAEVDVVAGKTAKVSLEVRR